MTRIELDALESVIANELAEFVKDTAEVMREVVEEVTEESIETLKATSPRKSGSYAKGWKSKATIDTSTGLTKTIHNRTPGLTHLFALGREPLHLHDRFAERVVGPYPVELGAGSAQIVLAVLLHAQDLGIRVLDLAIDLDREPVQQQVDEVLLSAGSASGHAARRIRIALEDHVTAVEGLSR